MLAPVYRSYRLSFLVKAFQEAEVHGEEEGWLGSFKFPMGFPESSTDSFHLLNFVIIFFKKPLITIQLELGCVFQFLSSHCIILSFCHILAVILIIPATMRNILLKIFSNPSCLHRSFSLLLYCHFYIRSLAV